MKTDLYTKIVLTVIALALTVNLFKSFFTTPAQAATNANKRMVEIPVNRDGTIDVNIKSINSDFSAFQFSSPLPVVIKDK
jgi:hypothetical protein